LNIGGLESMNDTLQKLLLKYLPIIISLVLVMIYLSALKHFDGNLWHWIDAFITIFTVIGVFYNYIENKKQLEVIPLYLQIKNSKLKLPTYTVRKNFTRAEVKGILSGIHNDKNLEIDYIDNPTSPYLKELVDIQQGKKHSLVILIKENDKFELKKDIHDAIQKTNI